MLSDEEKEALNILKAVGIRCKGINIDEVIINLIEKQSKEIERINEILIWKQKHEEQLQKEIEEWINGERVSIHCVHKNKIKAKIEELDFMIKEINQGHLQKYTVGELLGAKRFLQSLLEKE